jgi:hypothetical protein
VAWLLGLAWGLGLALFWPPFNTLLFRTTEGRRRVLHLTLLTTTTPAVAGVVGPLLGGILLQELGPPALFVTAGALFVGASFLALHLPRFVHAEDAAVPRPAHARAGFGRFAGVFLLQGFFDTSWLVYPLFLYALVRAAEPGTAYLELGLASAGISLLGALLGVGASHWADRRRTAWVPAALGALLSSVVLLILALVPSLLWVGLLGLSGAAGGLGGAVLKAYTALVPSRDLPSASAEREALLNTGRAAHLGLVLLLFSGVTVVAGTYPLPAFHRYFLVVGVLSFALPAWIVLTRLTAGEPLRRRALRPASHVHAGEAPSPPNAPAVPLAPGAGRS